MHGTDEKGIYNCSSRKSVCVCVDRIPVNSPKKKTHTHTPFLVIL